MHVWKKTMIIIIVQNSTSSTSDMVKAKNLWCHTSCITFDCMGSHTIFFFAIQKKKTPHMYVSLRYIQRYVSIVHQKRISNREIVIASNPYRTYNFFKHWIQENIQCPRDTKEYSIPQWQGHVAPCFQYAFVWPLSPFSRGTE